MNWIDVVRTVAPTLATALGGPLAGTATQAISNAVFGKSETDSTALESVIQSASPEILGRLKEAEMNFKHDMGQLEIDLERVHAGDRDSARKREAAVQDIAPITFGSLILIGFFGAFAASLFVTPPEASRSALDIMLGYLGGMASGVAAYYFGSSVGSKQKTDLLGKR